VDSLARLRITELGYAMPLQLWVQAAALGLKIVEFPVPLIYLDEDRSFGGSLDQAERRLAYYLEVIEREVAALHLKTPAKVDCRPASCGSALP
jgi:dolichol-phosphate mannosyltransferase